MYDDVNILYNLACCSLKNEPDAEIVKNTYINIH